jgi:hypothetical protein
LFDKFSRMATQIAMGPWQIRSRSKPFHPGCSYDVLTKLIAAGKVTERTIIRGPTTHQFWQVACRVPGVAHRLGFCHACHQRVKRDSSNCEHCDESFVVPRHRNELGLQFADQRAIAAARAELDEHHRQQASKHKPAGTQVDLLDTVLGETSRRDSATSVKPAASPPTVTVTGGDEQADTLDEPPSGSRFGKWLIPALIALNVAVLIIVAMIVLSR